MRSRIIRDIKARRAVVSQELERTVWRYLSRNTTMDPQIRMQAQLALSRTPREASPTAIKNRCIATGRGRGVINQWKLCRFQFRLRALNGDLCGVDKSSW
ncbi:40S ribosomal protein mrp2, mitochondrial [Coemansia sp. RSA 2706]|nr:40S ribosomal protein mrp2, mitochondrial [Coemansia sp. RSA 2706]KAJ2313593.1 40S ribosomal protein mrp2, mitochondrial [Coemansia sp. RSA 2705]KAJ2320653.1 40S ribosomal protein mrp2, mitochondrial [Coemansia sp. RSA 2704]KAJ2329132.1 40S ribosomal protein mrp2, mitochondrial [Coemansia sp. RSA 2702]KAJ2369468.1 40S ribosomal protein mrp2, mitochondrial [Coemansia sp. RSA 2610]KAJ2389552.1 40S ribosomal protein mrp2, mitochondrial [Coemansia sp. RSA 2611]KAJ2738437.1 40S ribosomal protei